MSKAPSMPMYWDAYLADTTHLSTEEHGAYLLLLAAMWRRDGSVPDDDRDNARILGITLAKWRKIKARLSGTIKGFEVENGQISQEKLRKTWEKTQEKIDTNRSNGAKGGRPTRNKNKGLTKADGSNPVNPIKTIPEPEPLEEDKSSSLGVEDFYSKYLGAHPKPSDTDLGFQRFSEIVESGVSVEELVSTAEAYAAAAKSFSDKNFIQHSDNFLCPERGNWKKYRPAPKAKPPSSDEILRFYGKAITDRSPTAATTINPERARAIVDAGYATPEQCQAAGVKI